MRPSPAKSMFSAAGCLGRPGMVIIFPARATTKPAPALIRRARTVRVKSFGAPSFFASSERLYCVLATHTGRLPKPRPSSSARSCSAWGVRETSAPP